MCHVGGRLPRSDVHRGPSRHGRSGPHQSTRSKRVAMTENTVPRSAAASEDVPRIAVVVGSTRPTRICPGIARWVLQAAQEESPLHYELLDLGEVNLPF